MGKRRTKRGKAAKIARAKTEHEPAEIVTAPHSFVIHHGSVGRNIRTLEADIRRVMEPYTAARLKVGKKNSLRDFVSVSGPLHVSHIVVLTKTELGAYLHLIRVPRGPTLTFKLLEYTLSRDIVSALKKPLTGVRLYTHFPLAVLNSFTADNMETKMMTTMFQNMFPAINIHKANLNDIRRCVLFNYNTDDKTIDFRHYAIKVVPCGLSKAVKKLMQNKVPDLSRFEDISDYVLKSGQLSDSEVEQDGADNTVVLPQPVSSGRGNLVNQQSAIRLSELGPRLRLRLVKIEDGVMTGEVLYHDLVTKSSQEVESLREKKVMKEQLKAERRRQQEENKKNKNKDRKRKKETKREEERSEEETEETTAAKDEEEDDDLDWYRKEVGAEPDTDVFLESNRKRKVPEAGVEVKQDGKKNKILKMSVLKEKIGKKDDKVDERKEALKKIMKLRVKRKKLKMKTKTQKLKNRRIASMKTHSKGPVGKDVKKKRRRTKK